MSRDERWIDLLERWAAADAEGRAVDPSSLCATHPELLPEVEHVIRFEARLTQMLRMMDSPETLAAWETSLPDDPAVFPVAPGYTIVRLLAEGGMGRVYHARSTKLERDVALKVIRPERLSIDLRARFAAEARAAARLDHPHIVQIYEVGEYAPPEGGPAVPFLALEFVSGGTLEGRAGTKPLPAAEAARVVALLARAMAHSHARGVVHRDLKPANVLLAEHADHPALNAAIGRPKITDFGLARRQDNLDTRLTSPGAVMGTPPYMAPEQADGRAAGPPADVYALGAILYRLLTGRVVFEADSVVDVLYHVCNTPPRPPGELAAGVPPALEALCLRCLAKDAADRPGAAELADALDHAFDVAPLPESSKGPNVARVSDVVLSSPDDASPPAPPRNHRWRLAAAALLALALPVGFLAWRLSGPAGRAVVPTEVEPLKGWLDAQMSRPGDPLRQNVAMNDPASRPMRPGDEIRVRAELNRPAYVYLVWIDSAGEVTPMYPWIDGNWKWRGPEEKAASFRMPQVDGAWEVWKMGPGKRGLETMVLLCRDEPLPEDVDLAGRLGRFGPQPLNGQDAGAVSWFENGETVRDEPQRAPLANPVKGGNPLERLNRELQRRVNEQFSYTRAITYCNEGDRP